MINEKETFKKFGYYSIDLSFKSGKKIIAICDDCGKVRELRKSDYRDLCLKCANQKISRARRGSTHSNATKQKISEARIGFTFSDEAKQKISETLIGSTHSDATKQKMSATKQGISYEEWEEFASPKEYCSAYNEPCKESNREKYDRRCFLCNKTEEENGRKQSVHHVDMDKGQGCDGKRWKLVPTCSVCHGGIHNELWEARIVYLLKNIWNNENYEW